MNIALSLSFPFLYRRVRSASEECPRDSPSETDGVGHTKDTNETPNARSTDYEEEEEDLTKKARERRTLLSSFLVLGITITRNRV